jgi:hypothetical protein
MGQTVTSLFIRRPWGRQSQVYLSEDHGADSHKFIYQKTMEETVKCFVYIHTYCCYAFVFIQCLLPNENHSSIIKIKENKPAIEDLCFKLVNEEYATKLINKVNIKSHRKRWYYLKNT